jgi:hypothetical protein
MPRVLSAALLVLLSGSAIGAQEVFGILRRADSDAPSQGTVVVAERVADGQVVARAVTGARGSWQLRVTADSVVIRALRIGFAPHVLDTVHLAAGERRELNALLPVTPVALPAVRTAADTRCRVRPESASLVAFVFHEARTALAASQLIAPDGPVRTRVRVSEEVLSPWDDEVLEVDHREYTTDALRPYRTAPVDSLLEFGFVTRILEPFHHRARIETAVEYRVPSVDLFLDDRFLDEYCLRLVESAPGRPDLIGVGFRPARTRPITQLEGTLWIDRRTSELRRMEFGYAGLDGSEVRRNPGGWLEFSRLERGLWFVSRWMLRVPALGTWRERRGRSNLRITILNVPVIRVNGSVLELAVDDRALFTAGVPDAIENESLLPLPALADSAATRCAREPETVSLSGAVRGVDGSAVPFADLRFFWREPDGAPDEWQQASTVAGATGVYQSCGIPQDALVIVEVRANGYEAAAITLRVGSPRSEARLDLTLVPAA